MAAKHRISITLFLLLILGNVCLFSQNGVNIEILPGFSGSFNAGYWIPLTVQLESDIPPFDGILEVSLPVGSIHRADRGSYTISRKISLEPWRGRRLLLTLPLPRREELTVRIIRDDEVIAEEDFTLSPFGYRGKTLLLLSRRPDLGIQGGRGWLSLSVHPEALPVSPAGYSSVAAVIFHDAPLNEISPLQVDALIAWVRGGGLLVVTGGIVDPGLLPVRLSETFPYLLHGRADSAEPPGLAGSGRLQLPASPSYPLWLGVLRDDASRLPLSVSGEAGVFPLEAVRSEGLGRVAGCLIDPAASPYLRWKGLGDYWELLLSAQPAGGREFPVTDPLPNLHLQLSRRIPASSGSLLQEGGWFLAPLLLLLVPAFLKRRLRGWLIVSIILPLAAAFFMVSFLPEEKPVYREISLLKGNFRGEGGDLWIKGGITSREGGVFHLPLGSEPFIVLPNGNESLTVFENPREVYLDRGRWETREFFLASSAALPVKTEVVRNGTMVEGFLRWNPGDDYRNAILLGGELTAKEVVLLPEAGGLSFRAVLSREASALEMEADYIKESGRNFSPAQRGYLDYLVSGGLLPREDGADFYFLLFSNRTGTILDPVETENIGLKAVLLEFEFEEIPYED
ncbi:MAG: hypothetical protein JEZ04_12515 [Spirochaetales bacterium]|nr:hypothetical protein [Spirochaetales bacterium]